MIREENRNGYRDNLSLKKYGRAYTDILNIVLLWSRTDSLYIAMEKNWIGVAKGTIRFRISRVPLFSVTNTETFLDVNQT